MIEAQLQSAQSTATSDQAASNNQLQSQSPNPIDGNAPVEEEEKAPAEEEKKESRSRRFKKGFVKFFKQDIGNFFSATATAIAGPPVAFLGMATDTIDEAINSDEEEELAKAQHRQQKRQI